ncbi:MAG: hypothetical protein AAGA63_08285 [Pseudomonadota bacterium]
MRALVAWLSLCLMPLSVSAQPIISQELGSLTADGVGLISPAQLGLPRTLFVDQTSEDLAAAFPEPNPNGPPGVSDLLRFIAKTEFVPPRSERSPSPYLLRRLSHLEKTGSIDALEALLRQIGTESPELFDRWLTAAIWLGLEVEACEELARVPRALPDGAMFFCTALNGNPNRAIALVEAAKAIGRLPEETANLYLFFFDPEIFEDLPISAPKQSDGAVEFLMRFDLGLPTPNVVNSLGPEFRMLNGFATWRERIAAAETLARAGSISGLRLFEIYSEGTPPASGQVWDRVSAAQRLQNQTFVSKDEVTAALPLFEASGLTAAFAEAIAPRVGSDLAQTKTGKCVLALAGTDDAPNLSFLDSEPPSPLRFVLKDSKVTPSNPDGIDLLNALAHMASDAPDLRLLADDLAVLRGVGLPRWADLIAVQIYARERWCTG